MKLAFLETLDTILKRGSFAAAAEEIGLTASAVSLQVKRLEEHFGQPLFVRSGRVARPTAIARELAGTVREAMAAMETLRVKTTPVVSGRVVLGTIRTVQSSALLPALRDLHRKYPKLAVRAIRGDSVALIEQLKAGVIDAAVIIRPTAGLGGRLQWHPLAQEQFVLIAPPDSTGSSLIELLGTYDWIQFDTALASGRMAATYLRRARAGARGTIEIDSIDTIVAIVSAGAGVSVVPKPRNPISTTHPVRELPLEQHTQPREIGFVNRMLDVDNRCVGALREAFDAAYGAPSPSSPANGNRPRSTSRNSKL